MPGEIVRILDTTLRDGLRNSGVTMTLEQKLRLARWLEESGVGVIEVGFGGPHQIESMRQVADAVSAPVVTGISRVNLKDVRRVIDGVGAARHPGINIFIPTSDAFLGKAGTTRERALDSAVKAIRYAKDYFECVEFSAQDATRSDRGFLVEVFSAAIDAGASVLCVADTVGHAIPGEFGALLHYLCSNVPGETEVTWSVHCHNELGLAVANSLTAIVNGARQVECTVDGIGERTGNTPMQSVVRALAERADAFAAVTTGVRFAGGTVTGKLLPAIIGGDAYGAT
jgi:2-isopropylmalate synthase